jgi:ubiquinone/menaquinone biosynthesis C-methylase UbiE
MPHEKATADRHVGMVRDKFIQQLGANLEKIRARRQSLYQLYENVDYESYWTGVDRLSVDQLEQTIVQQLLPPTGYRLVDVGCGYGRLADCYVGRFKQAILLDSSPSLLGQAVERTGGRLACVVADLNHMPFRDGSFDTTLMVRVFHHVEDSTACLRELNRVLSNDGHLVLSYRNKRDARSIIRWFLGRSAYNPFSGEPVEVSPMLTGHHPRFVDRAMRDAGFSITRYAGVTGALERLATKVGCAGPGLAVSVRIAAFFGGTKLTPWIFCQASVVNSAVKEKGCG